MRVIKQGKQRHQEVRFYCKCGCGFAVGMYEETMQKEVNNV